MSEYFFGLHSGHLIRKADRIAEKHDAWHVNFTEPRGEKRGWFCCLNQGSPFDEQTADAVMEDVQKAGGIDALKEDSDNDTTEWEDYK